MGVKGSTSLLPTNLLPSIAAWMECSYSSRPILHLADRSIISCCGVQQGDYTWAHLVLLFLHSIVEKIKDHDPGLLINAWYLDDGTMCGTLDDLCAVLSITEAEGPSWGLFLKRCKSLLHAPANFSDFSISHPLLYGIPKLRKALLFCALPSAPPFSAKQWWWGGSLKFRRSFVVLATFKILKWKLLSFVLASLSQSWHMCFGPALQHSFKRLLGSL